MRRYRNNKKHILSLILLCIAVCLSACSDTKGEDNDKNADSNVSVSLSETEERYCETLPYVINDHHWEKEDIYYPAPQTEYGEKGILYHKHLK